jgi:hypothetical protein
MTRLNKYIVEAKKLKIGLGLTALDIDDTIFHTFAQIKVVKDGKVVKSLNNQEFNVYKPKEGETFDFAEFRDAEFFKNTSKPIDKMVAKVKALTKNVVNKGSKVICLTARANFDNKEVFLDTFRMHGLPIDDIYVVRTGAMKEGSVSERKKKVIMDYLATGLYLRVRLFDDDITNCKTFMSIKKDIPESTYKAIRKKYNIGEDEISDDELIIFEAYLVDKDGNTKGIK